MKAVWGALEARPPDEQQQLSEWAGNAHENCHLPGNLRGQMIFSFSQRVVGTLNRYRTHDITPDWLHMSGEGPAALH